ncbi:hypothetical protein KGQ90_08910 [Modicisalibacter tunisiensis]|uniref:hypothetical protein n=1 Tax=Modicisalibacter tunisiensis TaxID=390637 RepID=UPI0007964A4C|nr:hypothetical protein [Modicisalibacter tunisiensis]KXS37900.1 MAG: hypothetical protein AWU55_1998 [Halomonadaceae bacterium T82-2]MBZ9539059.1 hypothetical protein [Modicisalibacter tunisiensis]
MYHPRLLLVTLCSALVAACAPNPEEGLPPYGASVHHMLQAQTYRPGDTPPPPTLHGDRAASTMDAYRRGDAPPAGYGAMMPDVSK